VNGRGAPKRSHDAWLRDNKGTLDAGNRRMHATKKKDLKPFLIPVIIDPEVVKQVAEEDDPVTDALLRGIGSTLKEHATGLVDSLLDPKATLQGYVDLLTNIPSLSGLLYDQVQEYRGEEDPEKRAEMMGSVVTEALLLVLPSPKQALVNKLNRASKKLGQAAIKVAAANNKVPKGFKQVKKFGFPHGQKVYKYKGKYYSRDIDGHGGGVWKVLKNKKGKLKRIGTADKDLKIFKK